MACEILTSLCTKLYDVVQTVKGNKKRCKEISERAQRLVPALERVSSSGDQEVSTCGTSMGVPMYRYDIFFSFSFMQGLPRSSSFKSHVPTV